MARVNEGLAIGQIKDSATAAIANVVFYLPELEPNVSASDSWCMLDLEYFNDNATRSAEWNAEGRLRAFISCRKSAGNTYAAKTIANSLATTFANQTLTVDESSTDMAYIRFYTARSRMLGEADGIISHYWEIDFFIQEA